MITKIFFTGELDDGSIIGPVRITANDKIRAEATGRNQGWPWADNPRTHSLMGFYAVRRAGLANYENYNQFMDDLVDFSMSNTDGETTDEDDPTKADTSDS